MEKLKRGQKLCTNCNTVNGVRSFNCKSCGNAFTMKKARKTLNTKGRGLVVDFKSLSKGDMIKVLKGSGPFHVGQDGERNYIGSKGKYRVDQVMEDGIMAVTTNGTHEFLYMGPVVQSTSLDTITRAPHKVVLIKKADVTVNG